MASLVTAANDDKAADDNEIEYQVRYRGGALRFFYSFSAAKQFAEECDEDFDTLSWRDPKLGGRLRIQRMYHLYLLIDNIHCFVSSQAKPRLLDMVYH